MLIDVTLSTDDRPTRYLIERRGDRLHAFRVAEDSKISDEIELDFSMPEANLYSLLVQEHSYEVYVSEASGEEDELEVHVLSRILRLRAVDARRPRARLEAADVSGAARILAPIPGRVVKLLQQPGAAVRRGDGIIVLEAMKMENELKSPRDGVVATIEVEEGQGVEGGSLLAIIE